MDAFEAIMRLRGYCRFRADGSFPERFINLTAKNRAGLWDIKRTETGLTACIAASGYKELRRYAHVCGLRLRVIKKAGLPFRLMPYRKRAGMPLGLILFFGVIWFLSLFVWYIDLPVVSPEVLPKMETQLRQSGLAVGVLRSGIDSKKIEYDLMHNVPEISWAGISIIDSHIIVDVREMEKGFDTVDQSQICNVVAAKGGLIMSISVARGAEQVAVGDTVAPGDLLISGIVEYAGGAMDMTNAYGEVWAQTGYRLESRVPLHLVRPERTGRVISIRRLSVLGLELPLYWGKMPQGEFEKESVTRHLHIGKAVFPVSMREEMWYEVKNVHRDIDASQAEELARLDITEQLSQLGNIEILSEQEYLSFDDESVTVSLIISARERIDQQELILFD